MTERETGGRRGVVPQGAGLPGLTPLLYAATARLDAHFAASAAATGLTSAQANAVYELAEPAGMRELGRRMCCEPPNVTFVVDRLEERGLVRRAPLPGDRRAKQVLLTEEGHAVRAALLERLAVEPPLRGLSDADRRTLRTLLARALDADGGPAEAAYAVTSDARQPE
ncbi:MarR family winged helix-turn-helix transcriptional regulator [Yinghuangia seranimata]|uniref:MarR family winged helix-turn-helix transcriptional regulator n=1 Tax=Yinghuangia seranimata TaxID=408067 RepID=UPI00248CC36F|nr:MarR family transcriptional regulator [Yinghuangia seranimata]MDI2127975.1 MarR family transcriptional regulator [Yinghuangia seranimata]